MTILEDMINQTQQDLVNTLTNIQNEANKKIGNLCLMLSVQLLLGNKLTFMMNTIAHKNGEKKIKLVSPKKASSWMIEYHNNLIHKAPISLLLAPFPQTKKVIPQKRNLFSKFILKIKEIVNVKHK
jgi:hypothetical protein